MHLPRSVFSHRQLDLFLWLLKVNQVDDVPSVKAMQHLNAALQKMCGIDSIAYNGALGHKYYVNSLPQIIAQEMANPNVRPHLSFYPEDSGPKLSEARQGERWLKELPDTQTTPMPAMLRDGTCCIPTRWFTKDDQFFANCWAMESVTKDEDSGWRVRVKSEPFVVPGSEFLKNFPEFRSDASYYGVPDPANIFDILDEASKTTTDWKHTDPKVGNSWRAKANGSRVVCFPLWMYCDDTSGNVSKKWNEHNSFLAQKEYNIHFLSTSNIAPPLEMLDGIVEQLDEAQKDGIWTWDVELNEPVLVIPSEFACHIGLRGKLFCRACWVKGTDALNPTGADGPPVNTGNESDGGSIARKRQKKVKETLGAMVQRVKAFVKIGTLRNKTETTEKLKSYFTEASTLDTKTKIQNQRTESGLFESYKNKRGRAAKQAALNARVAELPKITTSPVWRIKGLDPHQDTPVEILHVVLLGFVKYLWHDKKELLITRLSSLDVSGLGISSCRKNLVQYSGSLTGRDFRSIAQVAPFVIYDLVSTECFETWQALSKLIPLIWQPEIEDIETHIFSPACSSLDNRWFNKPKFHIILHLPAHIRRFGPAILFATEAFESFNAVIRAKSVHSNRHAPICPGNRIRHLLSGGLFLLTPPSTDDQQPLAPKFPRTLTRGKQSVQVLNTWSTHQHCDSYLGLDKKTKPTPGRFHLRTIISSYLLVTSAGLCTLDKVRSRPISETLIGQHIPEWSRNPGLFRTCQDLTLKNGDHPDRIGETFVGKVEEIIQQVGSIAAHAHGTDGLCPLLKCKKIKQDLICTVNVQHNCMDNQCGPTGSRPVFQERERTNQTRAQIAHLQNPTDVVLNTAQMRDAVHLQRFRINTPHWMNTPLFIKVL
ncbi:hypothetical protein B0H13DRAFT_2535282 [Mycena leptocephala]|nr:hypothetical protein B0H13DRAFT_2535282 [Mycena leptocephala]